MKTILFSLILIMSAIFSFAQADVIHNEHLTFKGVAIDGKLSDYVLNMKLSGFTLLDSEGGISKLEGEFAGHKSCIVEVTTLKKQDLVSKVAVKFPVVETWTAIWADYSALKELLTEKYGQPATVVEKFETSFEPADSDKMHYVESERITYQTRYELPNGSIQLSIENNKAGGFVQLTYYDKVNSAVIKADALSDL